MIIINKNQKYDALLTTEKKERGEKISEKHENQGKDFI